MATSFELGDEVRRQIEWLREQGPLAQSIATVLSAILKALTSINARLEEMVARQRDFDEALQGLQERTGSIEEQIGEIRSRLGSVELTMGAVAEAMLSRLALEAIREEGYHGARFARNYGVYEEDMDLLVWAEKNGEESLLVVEAKTRPKHGDVGGLLAKTELVQAKLAHPRVKPVLAAVYLSREGRSLCEKEECHGDEALKHATSRTLRLTASRLVDAISRSAIAWPASVSISRTSSSS